MQYFPFEDIRKKIDPAIAEVLPDLNWKPFKDAPAFGPTDVLDPRGVGAFVAWRAEHVWGLLREVWNGEFSVHYVESKTAIFGVAVKGFKATSESIALMMMIASVISMAELENEIMTELGYRFFDYVSIAKTEMNEKRLLQNERSASATYRLESGAPAPLDDDDSEEDGLGVLQSFVAEVIADLPDNLSIDSDCPLGALITNPIAIQYQDDVGFINFTAAIKLDGRAIIAIDARLTEDMPEYYEEKLAILSDNQIRYHNVRLQKFHGKFEIIEPENIKKTIQTIVGDYRKIL